MEQIEMSSRDARWKKPMRCYAAKTAQEAVEFAAKRYTEKGWTLPDECYVVQRRLCVEIFLPVTETER